MSLHFSKELGKLLLNISSTTNICMILLSIVTEELHYH